jgi:hypothetical protein
VSVRKEKSRKGKRRKGIGDISKDKNIYEDHEFTEGTSLCLMLRRLGWGQVCRIEEKRDVRLDGFNSVAYLEICV